MHGLLPRLGFFVDAPRRIPFDFHEILALIAPRPLMVVAPELDWDNVQSDVIRCTKDVRKVYDLFNASENLIVYTPYDHNRISPRYRPGLQGEILNFVESEFR